MKIAAALALQSVPFAGYVFAGGGTAQEAQDVADEIGVGDGE